MRCASATPAITAKAASRIGTAPFRPPQMTKGARRAGAERAAAAARPRAAGRRTPAARPAGSRRARPAGRRGRRGRWSDRGDEDDDLGQARERGVEPLDLPLCGTRAPRRTGRRRRPPGSPSRGRPRPRRRSRRRPASVPERIQRLARAARSRRSARTRRNAPGEADREPDRHLDREFAAPPSRTSPWSLVAKSSIPIISAIPTGSFAPDSPSRIVPVRPPISRPPSTENITAGSVGASAAPRIPAVVQPKPNSVWAKTAITPAVAKVPSTPSTVIGTAATRGSAASPTCMPPSKRITISATTAIRSTSTVDSSDRPGQMSEATAAATRKSAGGGTGKNSVSLCAPSASEERPGDDEDDQAEIGQLAHAAILSQAVSTYSLFADLPVVVDALRARGARARGLVRSSSGGRRVVRLHGDGEEGVGEDVIYDADDQVRFQAAGPVLDLAGEHTLDSLSARLEGLPDSGAGASRAPPSTSPSGRRGGPLHEVLGREPRPVTFVVSTSPPERQRRPAAALYPACASSSTRRASWDEALVARARRARRGGRRRLQGGLRLAGRPSDAAAPSLYRLVVEALPDALIEDPGVDRSPRRPRSSSRTATGSPGMRRSTRSRTSTPSRSRRRC